MLNLERIRTAACNAAPFPHVVVEDALCRESLDGLLSAFPNIRHPGSIPVSEVTAGAEFGALLDELRGDEFRGLIAAKFGIDLGDSPVMITVRGMMRQKDGRIHRDSRTKVVTVLLYFNAEWQESGGRLRILRSADDMDDYSVEIAPLLGTLVAFQVTDNCWHGHPPVVGKRLSIQLNYLVSEAARSKHQFLHRLSAKIKNLRS